MDEDDVSEGGPFSSVHEVVETSGVLGSEVVDFPTDVAELPDGEDPGTDELGEVKELPGPVGRVEMVEFPDVKGALDGLLAPPLVVEDSGEVPVR